MSGVKSNTTNTSTSNTSNTSKPKGKKYGNPHALILVNGRFYTVKEYHEKKIMK